MCPFNFVFHHVWFLSAQCVHLLHSVWALQLLTWSKPQSCESQNSPVYSWAWLPSTRSQQVGNCPLLRRVLVLKFRIVKHILLSHWRFYRRGDRSFRKAEKQRLKAEKRQLKAEVKEIRKQLRMERRGLQWSTAGEGSSSPVLLQPRATQANSPE